MDQTGNAPAQHPDMAAVLREVFHAAAAPGLASVYLFGSQAAGRSHRESDVDLGVLLQRETFPTTAQRFAERVHLSAWLAARLGARSVDVVILNDAPPQLARHIVTAGRLVFCSDRAADHALVRDVQLRAADVEPFLRRTRRVKLAAIAR